MSIVTRGLAGRNLVLFGLGAWLLVHELPSDELTVFARLDIATAIKLHDRVSVQRVTDAVLVSRIIDAIDGDIFKYVSDVYHAGDATEAFRQNDAASVYLVAAEGMVVYKIIDMHDAIKVANTTHASPLGDASAVLKERDVT